MKKAKKTMLILGCMALISPSVVEAASTCDYKTQVDLATKAANVKTTYEAGNYGTGIYEPLESDESTELEVMESKVKSSIYNITEDLYVTLTNKATGDTKTYYYTDTEDGTIRWETSAEEIIEYDIKIYSNNANCRGEELGKRTLKTPKVNWHYDMGYCNNNNNYYCQEFITEELNLSDEEVIIKATEDERKRAEQKEEENKQESFWKKYSIYIICSILVLGLIGVGTYVIVNKIRRSKMI